MEIPFSLNFFISFTLRTIYSNHFGASIPPKASTTSSVVARHPTMPCWLVIIFKVASLKSGKYDAVASSTRRHSNPRLLASRMDVWTHTSVVTPVKIKVSMELVFSRRSKSVP